MAKFEKRIEAHKLRRSGLSINKIAERLGVSKSSVSLWCRDIKLTEKQRERILNNAIKSGHKGRIAGAEANRKKRLDTIKFYRKLGEKEIGKLSKRDLLIAGIALYWGEGTKGRKLAFVNSDPVIIQFMYWWFQEIMGVKKEEFMPRIFINAMHRPRIRKVLQFWSSLLNLPKSQFGSPVFLKVKQKKIYENYDTYYGVLAIRIRNSAQLSYRIMGLIEALGKQKPRRGSSVGRASHS